ncbi:complement C1q-like protein 4 [Sphaeramia orbicularis]|uniref:Complement C1q-like protein 4 n=1 Tax=Sphaeramia orbicularis TaxID=375764 RepID=A0A673AGK0_9TELE|nr:complement C1q-like protein 4 [Sphaeramia orbicularis]
MFLPLLLLLFPAFLQGQSNDGSSSPNIYTELSEVKAKVTNLENQQQVRQVAFSASLLASGESTTGPFSDFTPLIYKHVVTNVGNAYNSDTGVFTAPVKGAYHFQWYGTGSGGRRTAGVLMKNGGRTFASTEGQDNNLASASNAITLVLEVGDLVNINLWPEHVMFDNQNHHCTFSGHLLFTM